MNFRLLSLITFSLCVTAFAQSEESTRGIWPPGFRPAPPPTAAKPNKPARPAGTYKRVTPKLNAPIETTAESTLGLTLWRLRPEEAADAKREDLGRITVNVNGETKSWIPERVEANTPFAFGQMVRLSIEIPRNGFLYVLDREQFADGSLGPPMLVYPQKPNENAVTAGRVIEIPNQDAESFAFRFDPPPGNARPLSSEMLTLLVTPKPLPELEALIGKDETLDTALLAKWEHLYGGPVEQLELKNGAGRTYTQVEKQAGRTRSLALTEDDPLPQTIFRVTGKRGNPLMVNVPLRISKP